MLDIEPDHAIDRILPCGGFVFFRLNSSNVPLVALFKGFLLRWLLMTASIARGTFRKHNSPIEERRFRELKLPLQAFPIKDEEERV